MNQNHYLHNLNVISAKKNEQNYTDRAKRELNEEFIALQKWVDQIPDHEESGINFNDENNTKFNHAYTSENSQPWSSDIKEEMSVVGTERTSEVTTEHCSEAKHWNSYKPTIEWRGNQPLYQFNIPPL